MESHLARAAHNQDFLECLEEKFPDGYFDWKITTCFYIAIHLLKAFGISRGVNIGETHEQIASNLDPGRCSKQITQFPEKMWKHYRSLYKYSRTSRYSGFLDLELEMAAREDDYKECIKHLNALKAYFKGRNIEIPAKAA